MPSRPPRQYLEATRIAQAPRSSRTAWLSQLFPVSDILDTTTGTATRRMPTLRLPGRMCDPPTINRLEILSICGSSATRWSQVQQAARGDESGHIGTRRLKPGGAGRGPNGATDGVALAEFELSEPARRFRDHHPLTAFQQIAARRFRPGSGPPCRFPSAVRGDRSACSGFPARSLGGVAAAASTRRWTECTPGVEDHGNSRRSSTALANSPHCSKAARICGFCLGNNEHAGRRSAGGKRVAAGPARGNSSALRHSRRQMQRDRVSRRRDQCLELAGCDGVCISPRGCCLRFGA